MIPTIKKISIKVREQSCCLHSRVRSSHKSAPKLGELLQGCYTEGHCYG